MRRLPVILIAAAVVVGCGPATPSAPSPSAPVTPTSTVAPSTAVAQGPITLAEAKVARLVASDADAKSAGAAVNAFGLALYARAKTGSGNVVVSPASIAIALSMARAGARGTTAAEMDAVLHDLASDAHAGWVASFDQALAARTGSFNDANGQSQQVTLRIANAPFAQRDLTLLPAYLDALAARFGAGVQQVDYRSAPEAARSAINGWVSNQTEQRIKELLAKGTVTDQTRLVLVNAIYLKAAWLHQFPKDATADAAFHRLDGSTVQAPMMSMGEELPYAAASGWRAVELPYVGGKLALDVIVPDDLSAFERQLDASLLSSITGSLSIRQVILGLPRFDTESALSLGDALAAMGMPTAFTDRADFTGITTDEPLAISDVIHQANIDVDENGTTAAAATAVMIAGSSMPSEQVTLTVDKPFLFALRDLDTGALLFLGRIVDPTAAAK
jgi:serpin B